LWRVDIVLRDPQPKQRLAAEAIGRGRGAEGSKAGCETQKMPS
jgi:hypothetical protein